MHIGICLLLDFFRESLTHARSLQVWILSMISFNVLNNGPLSWKCCRMPMHVVTKETMLGCEEVAMWWVWASGLNSGGPVPHPSLCILQIRILEWVVVPVLFHWSCSSHPLWIVPLYSHIQGPIRSPGIQVQGGQLFRLDSSECLGRLGCYMKSSANGSYVLKGFA